jgi:RNA polymerase sigma-70 factor (ECF subfamily)
MSDGIAELKKGNAQAFSLIFNTYYKDMVLFGGNFLPEQTVCEDIVQSIFLKLWRDRTELVIETSLKSYLLKAVRNACMDEIRHRHIVLEYASHAPPDKLSNDLVDTGNYILYSDLQKHLHQALEKLPKSYREAFELNRFEGLKYREIAEKLKVSERTIEVRISKSIGLLRKYLHEFLS